MSRTSAKAKSAQAQQPQQPISAALPVGTKCRVYSTGEAVVISQPFDRYNVLNAGRSVGISRFGYSCKVNGRGRETFFTAGDLIADGAEQNYSHMVRVK